MSAVRHAGVPLLAVAAIGSGFTALLTRPFTPAGTLVTMLGIGLIGVIGPLPRRREDQSGGRDRPTHRGPLRLQPRWLAVTAVGVGAFAAARALHPSGGAIAPPPAVALAVVAAVAEEAFFRRLLYGWLIIGGAGLAVAATALAFAVVHVPAYGVGALPIDLTAGLLFGWQRWATGGWTAPAVTHVAANLLMAR